MKVCTLIFSLVLSWTAISLELPFGLGLLPRSGTPINYITCMEQLPNVSKLTNSDFLDGCNYGFFKFWKETEFEHSTRYLNRLSEVEVNDATVFGMAIWIMYTRYVHWMKQESINPDQAQELLHLISFAEDRFKNPKWKVQPEFYFQLAFYLNLAGTYYAPKVNEEALKYYTLLVQAARKTSPFYHRRALLDTGHLYRRMGNQTLAVESYQQVLFFYPQDMIATKSINKLAATPIP